MDLALRYSPDLDAFDLSIDVAAADVAAEDTLVSAIVLSLMTDRLAESNEVAAGADRRGWWADAFAEADGDRFGSRWWLLAREKQIPRTLQRASAYTQEALAWLVEDGLADKVDVVAFAPRTGWLVVQIDVLLAGESRRYRFEWDQATDEWQLAGEVH